MPEITKRKIREDLSAHNPRVRIDHRRAIALFDEVLNESPELLAYVSGYSVSGGLLGATTYNVTYHNTDVPLKAIFRVRTADEAEDVFHRTISSFCGSVIISAPASVDLAAAYSSFNIAYDGFYSNLVAHEYQSWSLGKYNTKFLRLNLRYRIGKVKLIMMEREVDKEVDRLTRVLFTPDMPPETKAYVAHNYLARSVEYWLKEDADPLEMSYRQSAYGALINKKCVCQGYAEAFKRLMDTQGIENYVLCGKVKGSTVHHAWNAITFNGRDFWHVDVTWDSRGGGLSSHTYFCKTDEEMRPSRIWTRRQGVVCASRDNIYSKVMQDIFRNKARYISAGVDRNVF